MNLARSVLWSDTHSAVRAGMPPSALMMRALRVSNARFQRTPAAASWTSCGVHNGGVRVRMVTSGTGTVERRRLHRLRQRPERIASAAKKALKPV